MRRFAAIIWTIALLVGRGAAAQELVSSSPPLETDSQQPATDQTPTTRTGLIEQQQAEKAATLVPAQPGKAEAYVTRISDIFLGGQMRWHAFFRSAYSGGGFTMGAGYTQFVSPTNTLDTRGSITFSGYKRIESEFLAPNLFDRRGTLSAIGGWREATQVGFYGIGLSSNVEARTNYSFQQPYGSATLTVRPARNLFFVRGGLEFTQWNQNPGSGSVPSVETKYTPQTLPGLGAHPVYLHSTASAGIDSRPAIGYARSGTMFDVTFQDFTDPSSDWGFQQVNYEVIQHVPILRDTWVLSLHGLLQDAYAKSGQQIPFFMLPAIGGGDDLRAYASWRLRDETSLLLQAEWRVIVNNFLDMALFYDTGRVAHGLSDMTVGDLKRDVGLGFRFHGAIATPLRIELAKGSEGWAMVWAASHAF
ncbi:MAG TPA: hypothetical protein VH583_11120 [Vicinamibacterales bacterium]